MGRKMEEKMVYLEKVMAKSTVRRFLGIALLVFLVGLPCLYMLQFNVFNSFITRRILLETFTGVFNYSIVQWILLAVLTGITAVLLLIWVFNIGWYTVWYRYMVLYAAKGVGFLVSKFRAYKESILKFILVTLLFIAGCICILPDLIKVPKFLSGITFELLLKILAVFVIIKVFLAIFKLRKQIVFQKFKNLTGETGFDIPVEALQEVLINRFNHLKELIYTIDEINPRPSSYKNYKGVSTSINVSNAADSLKSLELPGQKIKLGSIVEIPLDFIVSALTSILKGPILTGSLHKRGNDLELIAHMSGRRFSGNWRVIIDDLDEEEKKLPEKDRLEKMVEHLSCMIFTKLVSEAVGSDRWQAVHRYTEGLRAYRQASKKEKGKHIYLRQAEKAFIDALNEDKTFVWCRYNLGVVYEELGQYDSAEVAFRKVLITNHENADVYFNLGVNYFYKDKYEDALWYAEQAIRLKRGEAQFWNLGGAFHDHSIFFLIATKLSWKNMCRSIRRGENNLNLKEIAGLCLTNLALAQDDDDKRRKIRLFNQSISISSGEGLPYFEMGKIFCSQDKWEKALLAFDKVYEEDHTLYNAIAFWALYVYACKKLISAGKADEYETRCHNAQYHLLDEISGKLEDFFDSLSQEDSCRSEDNTGIKKLKISELDIQNGTILEKFNKWVSEKIKGVYPAKQLKDDFNKWSRICLHEKNGEYEDWSSAQINIFLAKGILYQRFDEISCDCTELLESTLENLKNNHEREIRIHRLYGLLAECYLKSYKSREKEKKEEALQKALFYARKAVAIDPFSTENRRILIRVYFKLNDYDQAFKELKNCLLLIPDDLEILRYIPIIRNSDRVFFHAPERRKNFFKSLCEFLEEGLRQIKAMGLNDQDSMYSENFNTIYFKLGNFNLKLKNYDEAIKYLKIAETMGGRDALKAKIDQGWTYMEARAYNKAEQVFRELYNTKTFYPIDVRLGLAAAIIERTISDHGEDNLFEESKRLLDEAKQLFEPGDNSIKNIKIGEYRWYRARYYGSLGRIALNKGENENALKHFEKSVSINASPWGYYFLAEAYYRYSQEIKKEKQLFYLERAQNVCILTGNSDKKDLYCQEVNELKKKINLDLDKLKTDTSL